MEKYPLEILITARKIREDNAQRAVVEAKNALKEAEENLVRKRNEVEEYKIWCKEEEVRRFQEIRNTILTRKAIDTFKREIAALYDKIVVFEEAVVTAETMVEQAKTGVEEATKAYQFAIQQKEKIEKHKEHWQEQIRKEVARLEDLEMEEFAGKKHEDLDA